MNPVKAQEIFEKILPGSGGLDLLHDITLLSLAPIKYDQPIFDKLQDYADLFVWYKQSVDTFYDTLQQNPNLDPDGNLESHFAMENYTAKRELAKNLYLREGDVSDTAEYQNLTPEEQALLDEMEATGEDVVAEEEARSDTINGQFGSDGELSGGSGADGLGIGSEGFSADTLLHFMQNGTKEQQIDASWSLYKKNPGRRCF